MSSSVTDKFSDYEIIRDSVLDLVPDAREKCLAAAPKRNIISLFIGARTKAGISQKDLCEKAGWDKSYLPRLESASGGMPDLITVSRFAAACGTVAGIVFCHAAGDKLTIVAASSIDGTVQDLFRRAIDQSISLAEADALSL